MQLLRTHSFKYSGPNFFTSLFPSHKSVSFDSAGLNIIFESTFKALKPEHFDFYLMEITSFDRRITQFRDFFIYSWILDVKIFGPLYLKLCVRNNYIPLVLVLYMHEM